MNTTRPQRRALPNVFVDVDEYAYLNKKARDRGVTLGEVIREALNPLLEQDEAGSGRQVILYIPERTYKQFLEFFDEYEERAKSSMAGCLEVEGEEFARAVGKAAREMGGDRKAATSRQGG